MILAHAFGTRYDLPVPLYLFVVGGAAVVFVSFLVVLRRPIAAAPEEPASDVERSGPSRPVALLSVLLLLLLVAAGLGGSPDPSLNIVSTVFWLLVWVAVPITCGLVGDWTRAVNPFVALAHLADRSAVRKAVLGGPPLAWPERAAMWPATALLFAISCGELIFNATATLPRATAAGLLCYAVLTLFGALIFGANTWIARAEVFSVLFATWGSLGWFRFGARGRRGLLGGLDGVSFPASPSHLTFVLLLLVSVSFDGLLATPAWRDARSQLEGAFAPGTAGYQLGELAAYVLLVGLAWALFSGFARAVQWAGGLGGGAVTGLAGLLPSVLPIAFGYQLAHNVGYVAINGQQLLPLLGDPIGRGWWPSLPYPFDGSYVIDIDLLPSSVIWYLQVLLIVAVHVAAVILAHQHLGRTVPERQARRAEWPWIVAMVGYTMTSLWLLAQPLVKGS